jgi:hypothetical protein
MFLTILFLINEDLRMSLFCSPAMNFYYWTREFNQAIVFLSGTRCTVDMLHQFDKVKMQESSRPGESHPQALTEPYVRLSSHTALHVPHKLPSLHKLLVPPITG